MERHVLDDAGRGRSADLLAHAVGSAGDKDQQTPHDSADTNNGEQERNHARRVQFPGRQGC